MAPHKQRPADDGKRFPAMDVEFTKGSVSKGRGLGRGRAKSARERGLADISGGSKT